MDIVHLKNITVIHLKKQLEEKRLPTMGTKANLETHLEQAVRETGGNPDKFFIIF